MGVTREIAKCKGALTQLMQEKQKLIDQEKPQLRLEVKRLIDSKYRKEEERKQMNNLLMATKEEVAQMRQRASQNRVSYNTNKVGVKLSARITS